MRVRVLPGMPMESGNKVANLLKLMKMLEMRLSNRNKTSHIDFIGSTTDAPIYHTERLMIFLEMSLSEFNSVPFFTCYSFEDSDFIEQFATILVEGATIQALGSQALLEKGREFITSDSGISYDPPAVSDLLNSQYEQMYIAHWEKLKYIKLHIREFGK